MSKESDDEVADRIREVLKDCGIDHAVAAYVLGGTAHILGIGNMMVQLGCATYLREVVADRVMLDASEGDD